MAQPINPELKTALLSTVFRPAITTWNRLEGRPRREDFDRSLRVEVRDPLWMLCRQWQFGEFKSEDAGSAVKAKTQIASARLTRYARRNGLASGYQDRLPLETRVERETFPFDLMTRAQMGQHWLKMVEVIGDFKALYLEEFGFEAPPAGSEAKAQLLSDSNGWQTLEMLKGRLVDGARLLQAIESEPDEHENWLLGAVPNEGLRGQILQAATEYTAWFRRVYSLPEDENDSAWSDSYLEYQFAVSAPADERGQRQTVLVAEEYYQGHLDWYAFDLDDSPGANLPDKPGAESPQGGFVVESPISFIPNPIEFGGMPNVRWWEFEDRKTDFGDVNPSTSELATLILSEYGLIYGNDWSLIPYVVEAGTLNEVLGVVVTDVFGVSTLVRPAADTAGTERNRWGLYHLNTLRGERIDTRLFLPPVIGKLQESPPLERVLLVRDEMANMVWGIEDLIPGPAGVGVNGFEAASALERYLISLAPTASPLALFETGAKIRYKLGTSVPENWIPFIPVHKPGSNRLIRLQRAAMPRLIAGTPDDAPVEPRGAVLRAGLDNEPPEPYFLNNEEVSRAGVAVARTYQRVRWWDGRVYTWLGRRKRAGRGQGASGLHFDRVINISVRDV